jgi:putative FmdB family regulatory protein
MSVKEYRCKECQNDFTVQEAGSPEFTAGLKCPSCGSADVEDMATKSAIRDFLAPRKHFI